MAVQARFNKVATPRGTGQEVTNLASMVEVNLQELYGMIAQAQLGRLRLRTSQDAGEDPEDGDVILTTVGGARYIQVYNAENEAWESTALS